jgi:organic radical activating enzyme
MNKVKLIEVMNSWQGEGPDIGKRMLITRFKRCDRVCRFCDTMVKMRITAEAEYTLPQLQTILDEEKSGLMITGGEPTFDTNFDSTVLMLTKLKYPIANIESNGHRLNELIMKIGKSKNINYIFSPKFFTETELQTAKDITLQLKDYPNLYIKIVCENNELVHNYLHWLDKNLGENNYNHCRVFLMPEGKTKDELIKNSEFVFDIAEEYKFNFSSREHIIYMFI